MNGSQHRIVMAKWAERVIAMMAELDPVDIVDIIAEDTAGVDATAINATLYGRVRVESREFATADGGKVRLITAVDNNGGEWVPLLRTRPQHSRHPVSESWGHAGQSVSPWLAWIDQTALHDAVFGR